MTLGKEYSYAQHKLSDFSFVRATGDGIIRSLRDGSVRRALDWLEEFIGIVEGAANANFTLQSFRILLSELLCGASKVAGADVLGILSQNVFLGLERCGTVDEIRRWFGDEFFPKLVCERHPAQARGGVSRAVCKYIRENVYGDITLNGCARHAHVSPAYLSRAFKKDMHMSFLDYVQKCKLDAVRQMLLTTDDSIDKCAARIGYSTRNLYRMFYKQNNGMSPSEFRRKYRTCGGYAVRALAE
jgi:AraC-like DNA-binding protein